MTAMRRTVICTTTEMAAAELGLRNIWWQITKASSEKAWKAAVAAAKFQKSIGKD